MAVLHDSSAAYAGPMTFGKGYKALAYFLLMGIKRASAKKMNGFFNIF